MGINIDQAYAGETMNAAYVKTIPGGLKLVINGAEMRKFDDGTEKCVLSFSNHDKTLALNVTNAKFIGSQLQSMDTDYWMGSVIELSCQPVRFGGKMVDGIVVTRAFRPGPPTGMPPAAPAGYAPAPSAPPAPAPPPPAPAPAPVAPPAASKNSAWAVYCRVTNSNDPGPFYAKIADLAARLGYQGEAQFQPHDWAAMQAELQTPPGAGIPSDIPF